MKILIYSRAFPPVVGGMCRLMEMLAEEFVRNYYRYADQIFQGHQSQTPHADLNGMGFDFEIYASSEYSRMLEREWNQ